MILFSLAGPAAAADIEVSEPWVREGPPNARVLGGFMTIINHAKTDVSLLSASSTQFNSIELHKTEMVDGVGKMIPQQRIVVPAGGTVELKPGSYHLMLMGAVQPLRAGDSVVVELQFDTTSQSVEMPVRKADGMMDSHHHHHQ
jgi:copper(I)-binding protein